MKTSSLEWLPKWLKGRWTLVGGPLRDRPGYVKEGRTPPARPGATCRGAARAERRRAERAAKA